MYQRITRLVLLILLVTFFAQTSVFGQFEQKLTLQLSAGAGFIVSDYENEGFFNMGPMFNGGMQYNFNRQFSLTGLAMYGMYFSDDEIISDATFFKLGLGISAKYKFFPYSGFRPYLLAGGAAYFVRQEFFLAGKKFVFEAPLSPGIVTGLGFEIDLSENFTLFLQGGFNKLTPFSESNLPPVESVYTILGININMFKSKTL